VNKVRRIFEAYAQRGVFRSYSETHEGEFRFTWLWNLSFHVTTKPGTLRFNDLLPGIRSGSKIESDLRNFIASCASKERPVHRRWIPARMAKKQGMVSLVFKVSNAEDVRKAINLVNEIFLSHLNLEHPLYVSEHLHESDD
jgi:hypothetical protein